MHAASDQKKRGASSTSGSPFVQLNTILDPHILIDAKDPLSPQKAYSLGWYTLQLPGDLSAAISDNGSLVKDFPVIGKSMEKPPHIIFHASALLGYLGAAILIPETQSAIVVLANTLGLQDAPNWISSMLLEELIDVPHRNDYASLAKEAAGNAAKLFPDMFKLLEENRLPGTPMKSPSRYLGKFYNPVRTWHFDIFQEEGCTEDDAIYLAFCGDRTDVYKLHHYNYDVFSWAVSYESMLSHQLWPIPDAGYYLLEFKPSKEDGELDQVVWKCSWGHPDGEVYTKLD
jgi:hypothetical protein